MFHWEDFLSENGYDYESDFKFKCLLSCFKYIFIIFIHLKDLSCHMVKTKHHEAIPMAGSFNKSIPSLKPSKSSFAALNHSQLNQLGQLNQVSQTTAAQAAAAQAAQNSRLSSLMDLNPAASSLYGQTLPPYTKGLICNIGDRLSLTVMLVTLLSCWLYFCVRIIGIQKLVRGNVRN